MGKVIGDYLALAVALTVIPIPIIAVILILFSGRARGNSLAFLVAWLLSIAAAMAVFVSITSTQDVGTSDDPSSRGGWAMVVLGVVLIGLAVRGWRKRPAGDAEMPSWMTRVESLTPIGAAGLAVVLAVVNPKNLLLIAGGAVVIAQADLSAADQALAIAIFTLIGSLSIAIPTLGYLILGAKAQPALDGAKAWLLRHSGAVMAVLLLVIGVVLLGRGISALS